MLEFTILKLLNIIIHPTKMKRNINSLWWPPSLGWITRNTNGATMGIPHKYACGDIFRNHKSEHINIYYFFIGDGNALVVEFIGEIMAMWVAIDKHWDKIWIEIDSLIVVKALSNTNFVPWSIKNC